MSTNVLQERYIGTRRDPELRAEHFHAVELMTAIYHLRYLKLEERYGDKLVREYMGSVSSVIYPPTLAELDAAEAFLESNPEWRQSQYTGRRSRREVGAGTKDTYKHRKQKYAEKKARAA